jgi:hypothetical protein
MRRLLIAVAAVTMLAGCGTAEPTASGSASPTSRSESSTTPADVGGIDPDDIATMDEGIAWARALDDSVTADELSLGIDRITGHLLDEEIDFETSNEIGQALMQLDAAVSSEPDSAGERVDELKAIVDRIEAA